MSQGWQQQLYYKGVFDYNSRFASAVSLLSSGKVVITDRLHGSIFAFLSFKATCVYRPDV